MSLFRPLDPFDCELDGINLIEASAGTGKTWNICWLFLRLLLERGLDVRQILVVTFTHAATAELRDRIRSRLVETRRHLEQGAGGEGDPFIHRLLSSLRERQSPEISDRVRIARIDAALGAFDDASIFTIHGFCQRALSDAAFAAGMPIRSEVLSDESLLQQQAVNDFWRQRVAYGALPAGLLEWLLHCGDSPTTFATALRQHLAQPLARRIWPTEQVDPLSVNAEDTLDELLDARALAKRIWRGRETEIIDRVESAMPGLHKGSYKPQALRLARSEWESIFAEADPLRLLNAPLNKAGLLGSRKLRTATNKKGTTPEHEFFDAAQRFIDLRDARVHQYRLARLGLVDEMLGHCTGTLDAEKRRLRAVSFNDMLRNLHARLHRDESGWLAGLLRKRFPAALIDEFQDTDPLQFGIFDRIWCEGPGPLFLVGDPKQSIYRFRQADLHTYLSARRRASRHYTLEHNQRSSPALIDSLNRLFSSNRALFMFDGLDYRAAQVGEKPRKPLNDASGAAEALQVWMLPGSAGQGERISVAEGRQLSADACAAEVGRLLHASAAGQTTIGERPLRASDIAILVKSHADAARMRRALENVGIACVERSQQSVFRTRDAEEIERVLAAALEPTREALVRAALATEAMGLDAGGIAAIDSGEPETTDWSTEFVQLRQYWLEHGIGFMLRQWMTRHQVISRLLARPDGERRLTNLLHLAECLQAASPAQSGADALLNWLRNQRERTDRDDSAQLRLESDENLVQVVTIHASKGLEYPVVFCPFLWTPGLKLETSPWGVDYHDDQGQAILDYRKDVDPDFDGEAVKDRRRLEAAAEFIRLIYVALTRAVDRCILVAGCCSSGKSDAANTRGLLNWIVAGQGCTPDVWLDGKKIDAARIDQAWFDLAAQADSVRVGPIPTRMGDTLLTQDEPEMPFQARRSDRRLTLGWRMGSYSQLALGASSEAAAVDHDARIQSPAQADGQIELPNDDILSFPRGPQAGNCLHRVFETIDFREPAQWAAAVASALDDLPDAADSRTPSRAACASMIDRMLADVLATPLPFGTPTPLILSTLPRERRLDELEFHLPCRSLHADRLNALLARHGYPGARFSFRPLEGFLKGFIDLVLEHDGRYFIVDWKSNWLGTRAQDYSYDRMHAAMIENAYHLQYLLYGVALDRLLRSRIAGYQAATHFGGVAYLFIRGIRPDWLQADGSPAGVYFDRPDPSVIESLSALLDAGDGSHG
jgi:exodeoxyribonuclease V beta subunit